MKNPQTYTCGAKTKQHIEKENTRTLAKHLCHFYFYYFSVYSVNTVHFIVALLRRTVHPYIGVSIVAFITFRFISQWQNSFNTERCVNQPLHFVVVVVVFAENVNCFGHTTTHLTHHIFHDANRSKLAAKNYILSIFTCLHRRCFKTNNTVN